MSNIDNEISSFLSTPKKQRIRQKQKATQLGITAVEFSRRKRKLLGDGDTLNFDIKEFLSENKQVIATALLELIKGKKSVKSVEVALRALGELVDKREETVKVELTATDYTRIARETINGLREEYQSSSGRCPVCFEYKAFRHKARLDSGSELSESSEVAAVVVSP